MNSKERPLYRALEKMILLTNAELKKGLETDESLLDRLARILVIKINAGDLPSLLFLIKYIDEPDGSIE
jgi:hypothetical protein